MAKEVLFRPYAALAQLRPEHAKLLLLDTCDLTYIRFHAGHIVGRRECICHLLQVPDVASHVPRHAIKGTGKKQEAFDS